MAVGYTDAVNQSECDTLHLGIPTFQELRNNPPPEYIPLISVAAAIVLASIIIISIVYKKHRSYTNGPTAPNAIRSILILFAFLVFAVTSFAGMLSPRSGQFLHLLANVFEVVCILLFYENIVNHLRVNEFFDNIEKLVLHVPPCCCCLRFLSNMNASEESVKKLRIGILASILSQFVLETLRLMRVMECRFQPLGDLAVVIDALTLVIFLFAIWAIVIFYRAGHEILAKYNYTSKFVIFKLMILICKLTYTILSILARLSMIPDFHVKIGDKDVMVVNNKTRVFLWTNFVTIVSSTLLLLLTFRKYKESDYDPWLGGYKLTNGEQKNLSGEFEPLTVEDKPLNIQPIMLEHINQTMEPISTNLQTEFEPLKPDYETLPPMNSNPEPKEPIKRELESPQYVNLNNQPMSPEFRAKFIPLKMNNDTRTEEIVMYIDENDETKLV